MGFETYLVESANQMNQLLVEAEVEADQTKGIVEASVIGCRALRRLADDKALRSTLKRLRDPRAAGRGRAAIEFQRILEDMDRIEHFLDVEYEVLLKGGMAAELAAKVIDQCRSAVSVLIQGPLDRTEQIEAIRSLRDQACEHSNVLTAELANARKVAAMENQMWKITLGICGVGLIGLNAALSAKLIFEASGFETVGGSISAALGGAILKGAASTPKALTAGGRG